MIAGWVPFGGSLVERKGSYGILGLRWGLGLGLGLVVVATKSSFSGREVLPKSVSISVGGRSRMMEGATFLIGPEVMYVA